MKTSNAVTLAGQTLQQTGPSGQKQIRNEVEELQRCWQSSTTQFADVKRHLETTLAEWDSYDSLRDELERWLHEIEHVLEDQTLMSSVAEKKTNILKLKVNMQIFVRLQNSFLFFSIIILLEFNLISYGACIYLASCIH